MTALFKWKTHQPPAENSVRTVSRFLLLPRELQGEERWLGFERIKQRYQWVRRPFKATCGGYSNLDWVDVEWAE